MKNNKEELRRAGFVLISAIYLGLVYYKIPSLFTEAACSIFLIVALIIHYKPENKSENENI